LSIETVSSLEEVQKFLKECKPKGIFNVPKILLDYCKSRTEIPNCTILVTDSTDDIPEGAREILNGMVKVVTFRMAKDDKETEFYAYCKQNTYCHSIDLSKPIEISNEGISRILGSYIRNTSNVVVEVEKNILSVLNELNKLKYEEDQHEKEIETLMTSGKNLLSLEQPTAESLKEYTGIILNTIQSLSKTKETLSLYEGKQEIITKNIMDNVQNSIRKCTNEIEGKMKEFDKISNRIKTVGFLKNLALKSGVYRALMKKLLQADIESLKVQLETLRGQVMTEGLIEGTFEIEKEMIKFKLRITNEKTKEQGCLKFDVKSATVKWEADKAKIAHQYWKQKYDLYLTKSPNTQNGEAKGRVSCEEKGVGLNIISSQQKKLKELDEMITNLKNRLNSMQ